MAIEFDKCCFCIDLRIGCLIIGYLNLIGNIALIIITSFTMTAAGMAAAKGPDHDMQTLLNVILAITGVLLVFYILFLAFSIILLVGIHQHKRGHVKAYMIYTLIFLVLQVIMFFASFAGSYDAGSIIRNIITIILGIYFLLVIKSYYNKMDGPVNKPTAYNTA